MEPSRPTILISEHLSQPAINWLRERAEVVQAAGADDPVFINSIAHADGLVVRTYTRIDVNLLDLAPKLRVVGRAGAGLDNIDVAACRARGIEVVYAPDANTQAVVEYVLGLMIDAIRPRPMLDQPVDVIRWNQMRSEAVGQRDLGDLTLGIFGLGRVGKRLAQLTRPLMRSTIYNDLLDVPAQQRHGAEPVPVAELFAYADVLSVHIDGRPENRNLIDERLLSTMKSNVVFINTSRGFVVDSRSLRIFLREYPGSTALLDVHDPEPFGADYPLLGLPNARLYPHLASRTMRAMESMSWVVRDVMAVLEGGTPRHPAPQAGAGC